MDWVLQIALLLQDARRLRPFGFGFGLGHTRVIAFLIVLLIGLVIAAISRRNKR